MMKLDPKEKFTPLIIQKANGIGGQMAVGMAVYY